MVISCQSWVQTPSKAPVVSLSQQETLIALYWLVIGMDLSVIWPDGRLT